MKNNVCLRILLSEIQRILSSSIRHSYTEYKKYMYRTICKKAISKSTIFGHIVQIHFFQMYCTMRKLIKIDTFIKLHLLQWI